MRNESPSDFIGNCAWSNFSLFIDYSYFTQRQGVWRNSSPITSSTCQITATLRHSSKSILFNYILLLCTQKFYWISLQRLDNVNFLWSNTIYYGKYEQLEKCWKCVNNHSDIQELLGRKNSVKWLCRKIRLKDVYEVVRWRHRWLEEKEEVLMKPWL